MRRRGIFAARAAFLLKGRGRTNFCDEAKSAGIERISKQFAEIPNLTELNEGNGA